MYQGAKCFNVRQVSAHWVRLLLFSLNQWTCSILTLLWSLHCCVILIYVYSFYAIVVEDGTHFLTGVGYFALELHKGVFSLPSALRYSETIKVTPNYEDILLGTVHIQTCFPVLLFSVQPEFPNWVVSKQNCKCFIFLRRKVKEWQTDENPHYLSCNYQKAETVY